MAQCPPSCTLGTCTYDIRLLLAHGADVNACAGNFGSVLQGDCLYGSYHAVRLLLSKGADVYLKDGAFGSALHAACSRSDTANSKVVYLLLQAGADVDARVRRGRDHLSALEIVICSLDIGKVGMMLPHN
jgi:ankyrin repeat protein